MFNFLLWTHTRPSLFSHSFIALNSLHCIFNFLHLVYMTHFISYSFTVSGIRSPFHFSIHLLFWERVAQSVSHLFTTLGTHTAQSISDSFFASHISYYGRTWPSPFIHGIHAKKKNMHCIFIFKFCILFCIFHFSFHAFLLPINTPLISTLASFHAFRSLSS